MSRENVEVVRRFYEAWNAHDRDPATLAFLDPEFEWVNPDYAVEPGTRRGHVGFIAVMETMRESFVFFEHLPGEFRDLGDTILCFALFRARTRGGLELDKQEPHVWTLRDGLILRLQWFHDRLEAVEAVGLRE
jgi:ketosteroid isomerase-like protein